MFPLLNCKRVSALLLVLLLISTIPLAAHAEAPAKHIEISVAIWNADATITTPEEDAILKTICDKLNITLTPVNITWDDYEQKIQVWAASDQLPDVFSIDAINKPYYSTWIRESIVRSLPEDLSIYPNLNNVLSGADYQAHKWSDGLFYCIPRPTYESSKMFANSLGLLIRKDWMEALGYTNEPDSLESFIHMLDDIAKNNPEGRSNVVPFTAFDYSFLTWVMKPYSTMCVDGSNPWVRSDGKWIPAILTPEAKEGVLAMAKMWQAGLVDSDIVTLKEDEGMDKFASGRAASYAQGGYPTILRIAEEKFKKTYPDKDFSELVTLVKPWKNKDGTLYYQESVTPWSESYINYAVDDEKLERILMLYDYLLSDEGLMLVRNGIEGRDYEYVDGQFKLLGDTPLQSRYPFLREGANFLATWDEDYIYESAQFSPYIHDLCNEMLQWYWDNGVGDSMFQDFRNDYLRTPLMDTMTIEAADDMLIALTSEDPGAAWDVILQHHLVSGYQEIIDEFNETAKQNGIIP